MTTHSVRYEALSQVSLSRSDSSVNFVGTERLISGQTLRGAMAALWWRQPGADPAGFASLFDTDLSVSQAVPLGAVLRSAAAHVCKYLSSPACKTVLVDDAVLDLSGHAAVEECWECSGPLEADSGWGSLPNTTVRTRSSLDADETSEGRCRRDVHGHQGYAEPTGAPDDRHTVERRRRQMFTWRHLAVHRGMTPFEPTGHPGRSVQPRRGGPRDA